MQFLGQIFQFFRFSRAPLPLSAIKEIRNNVNMYLIQVLANPIIHPEYINFVNMMSMNLTSLQNNKLLPACNYNDKVDNIREKL